LASAECLSGNVWPDRLISPTTTPFSTIGLGPSVAVAGEPLVGPALARPAQTPLTPGSLFESNSTLIVMLGQMADPLRTATAVAGHVRGEPRQLASDGPFPNISTN
jgi:hypothetical protein